MCIRKSHARNAGVKEEDKNEKWLILFRYFLTWKTYSVIMKYFLKLNLL